MDLRGHLRQATDPAHRALEAAFDRLDLTTAAGLRRFLLAHRGAVTAIERRLHRADGDWAGCWQFDLSALLAGDLADLDPDTERPDAGRSEADIPPALPPLDNSHPVGLCYVLGGSRLGAAVIAGRLRREREPTPPVPRYLTDAPDREIWARTLDLLARVPERPEEIAAVSRAAEQGFACFSRALAGVPNEMETGDAVTFGPDARNQHA